MKTKTSQGRYLLAIPGLALVLAGILKVHATLTEYTSDGTSTVILVIIELEILVGLWLITGIYRERARSCAIAIFAGLWISNLCQVLAGRCSCGCFGVISVDPWIVLAFDSIVLIFLIRWHLSDYGHTIQFGYSLEIIGALVLTSAVAIIGVQRQTVTVIVGKATWRGQPLIESKIVLRGGSLEFPIVTQRDGSFQSPPIRPGQYSLSIKTPQISPLPKIPMPSRNSDISRFDKFGRISSTSSRSKTTQETRDHLSMLARQYDEIEIVPLVVDECARENVMVNFE